MLPPEKAKEKADEVRNDLQSLALICHGPGADYSKTEITCERCSDNDWCEFAWDLYNTNGDCLAIK